MAAQKGKDIYVLDGTGTAATAIACLRSTEIKIDGETVDVTSRDSNGFRELLGASGIVKLSVSGDGVVDSGTGNTTLAARAIAQSLDPYTIVFGNGDKYAALFQLNSFSFKGEYNNVQTYSFGLESSGTVTQTLV